MIARIFRGRAHCAWVVAAATFVVLLTAAGFRATPGVLLLPLQNEFGWSPALIGGAVAVNLFGRERVGVVFAWVFACHQFGAAFAAWGAGASRTWFGSYEPTFLVAGTLGVAAAALSLSVGRRGLLRPTPSPA